MGRRPEDAGRRGARLGSRQAVEKALRFSRSWELFRLGAPLLGLGAVGGGLAWLNRSPWWGWVLVGGLIGVLAVTSRWWARGPWLLRAGAWLMAAMLVGTAAVLAHPLVQNREVAAPASSFTAPIETRDGPVQGVRDEGRGVETFAGIPYAQAPVGDLRWKAPQSLNPREEILRADEFSAAPVQGTSTFFTRALSQVVDVPLEGTLLNPYPVSEDSLSLNIWRSTAPSSENLPVLVYIPGGGFATGSGALPLYDGAALAARGQILTVTINYRLGVLGFLSHPELSAESPHDASGNYGILDQLAALQWVQDNIAAFGGDPARVTVAGESAGGESACILGATPLAEGLVDGLIASSGACMGTTGDTERGDQADSRDVALQAGQRLSRELGEASLAEMREMSVEEILDAAEAVGPHWRPSVDCHVLPRPPAEIYASGKQLDVPTLVGSNADEASLALADPPSADVQEYRASARETYGDDAERYLDLYPGETEDQVLGSMLQAETDKVMTRAMHRWAHLQTETGHAPAYLYYFTHVPPEEGLEQFGAYHGAEVAYAYDNLGADSEADYTATDYRLRDQMSAYWISFVRTGDPNAPGLPRWPPVEEAPQQVMEFGAGSAMSDRPRPEAVDFWGEADVPIP